jgi:hypothetical protein
MSVGEHHAGIAGRDQLQLAVADIVEQRQEQPGAWWGRLRDGG